jgi:hypothetical protein
MLTPIEVMVIVTTAVLVATPLAYLFWKKPGLSR